jgi:hypothetical protein
LTRELQVGAAVLFLSLSWAVIAVADADERMDVGHVARLQNLAHATYAEDRRRLEEASDILMQDLLTTGRDSRLKVVLKDGSSVHLGEDAEILVDDFVYTPREQRAITLNLVKGALRYIGSKMRGKTRQDVKIETPVLNLGVRGTDFWLGPIDGATGVLVLQGRVLVSSRYGLVSLAPGEGTMVADDGTLTSPITWGEDKKRRALEMVGLP